MNKEPSVRFDQKAMDKVTDKVLAYKPKKQKREPKGSHVNKDKAPAT